MADKYTPERATSGKERLRTWWKKVENNFVKIFGAVNKHIDGTADRHTADMIDYSDTETVRAKLDSTDTKLDTKVDKVSGKSLIGSGVADNLEYDTDKEEILIKVSKPSQGLRVKSTAFSESTQITSGSIDIESDASGLGNYLSLSPFGGIMINTPTTSNADIRLVTPKGTHKISEKANTSDVFLKSDDVVLADGKKVSLSSSESGNDGTLTIRPTGISLSRDTSMGTNDVAVSAYSGISVGGYGVDISINTIDGEQHKLSEKADKAEVFLPAKDIALESGKKISITNSNDTMAATLSGEEFKIAEKDNDYKYARISANDVEVKTYYTDETNDPVFVTHKLSEKVNSSNVLTKTNTAAFTPTGDYQPATKKYVDDTIKAAIEKYNTEAMALLGED